MTISWIHLVGLYLLIGSLVSGLGLLAKIRLAGYTKPLFSDRRTRIWFGIGVVVGVLFWPVVILLNPLIRKLILWRALKFKDRK
jgi:hypothetical protein